MKSPAFFGVRPNGGVSQKSSRDGSGLRRFRIEAPSAASSSSSISASIVARILSRIIVSIASGPNPGDSSLAPTLLSLPTASSSGPRCQARASCGPTRRRTTPFLFPPEDSPSSWAVEFYIRGDGGIHLTGVPGVDWCGGPPSRWQGLSEVRGRVPGLVPD